MTAVSMENSSDAAILITSGGVRLQEGVRLYVNRTHVMIRKRNCEVWFGPNAWITGGWVDTNEPFRIDCREAILSEAARTHTHVHLYRPKARQRGRWRRHRRYSAAWHEQQGLDA